MRKLLGPLTILLLIALIVFGRVLNRGPQIKLDQSEQVIDYTHQETTLTDTLLVSGEEQNVILSPRSRDEFSNEEKMNIHMCLMGHGEGCLAILDPANKLTYADVIQEQCDIMPGMDLCARYFATELPEGQTQSYFDTVTTEGLEDATPQSVVVLEDGDTYDLRLQDIKKTLNGNEVRMLGYNGSIPGPLIRVPQGSTIKLRVKNLIEDIETTVHHHGLRLDNKQDGVPKMMGGFDTPLSYGELKTYTLTFPDEGIYWYHPHVREDLQQELGLYGNYLVTPANENYWNPVNHEEALVIDDILLTDDGIAPIGMSEPTHVIMGRFGNYLLVNGENDYTFDVDKGAVTRLYLTNTANVRPFYVRLRNTQTGQFEQVKLIGSDIGKYEYESRTDGVLIAPAERYIIEIITLESGTYELIHTSPVGEHVLTTINVSQYSVEQDYSQQFNTLEPQAAIIQDIDRYRQYFDKEIDHTLRLDMTMGGKDKDDLQLLMHEHEEQIATMGGLTYNLGKIEWEDDMVTMNEQSTPEHVTRKLIDEDTGKENMDINRTFNEGDVVKVRIINDSEGMHPMQHPIHFHGQRFLVVSKNGQKNTNLVWKDTVLTEPGDVVDLLIDMSNPGKRMAHCHISEHMHAGMMMNFIVTPVASY